MLMKLHIDQLSTCLTTTVGASGVLFKQSVSNLFAESFQMKSGISTLHLTYLVSSDQAFVSLRVKLLWDRLPQVKETILNL